MKTGIGYCCHLITELARRLIPNTDIKNLQNGVMKLIESQPSQLAQKERIVIVFSLSLNTLIS